MEKKDRFIIGPGNSIRQESDYPEDFQRELADINAKHGTDAQVVFEELARRLGKRALAAVEASRIRGKGGAPKGRPINGDKLRELRGDKSRSVFAGLLGIDPDTLATAEKDGPISQETRLKIERYIKALQTKKLQRKA